jgi:hypothetical protein
MYGYGQAAQAGNPYGGYTQWQPGAAQSYMDRLNAMLSQVPPAQQPTAPPNPMGVPFNNGADMIYVKKPGGAGTDAIQAFKLVPIDTSAAGNVSDTSKYVTRAEFDALRKEVEAHGQQSVRGRSKPVSADNADNADGQ